MDMSSLNNALPDNNIHITHINILKKLVQEFFNKNNIDDIIDIKYTIASYLDEHPDHPNVTTVLNILYNDNY